MTADASLSSPYFTDDLRHSPIVVRTFHRVGTDAEFEQALDAMGAFLARDEHFGFVIDFGDHALVPQAQRKRQAHWLKANYEALAKEPFGNAMVVRRAVHRFVISSIYLVTDIPGRNSVVPTVEDGICFVAAGMLAAGHPLPESVRQIVSRPARQPAGFVASHP